MSSTMEKEKQKQLDKDVSRWIIEFLIRQQTVPELLIKRVISVLPLANNNSRFKKFIILRSIHAEITEGSVSESILESLQIIEDLDHKEGIPTMDSMKSAYCAVAVECTVKYLCGGNLIKNSKYLDAVKRIWRGRIKNLEERKTELVTEQMNEWKDEIEAALWDTKVCKRILEKNTRNDALTLVRAYLEEVMESLGPSFPERVATLHGKNGDRGQEGRKVGVSVGDDGDELGGHEFVTEVCDDFEKGQWRSTNNMEDLVVSDKETQEGNATTKVKQVAYHRRYRGRVRVTDSGEVGMGGCCSKYNSLPTYEVQEALKASSLDLHARVNDPLPDAILYANAVVSEIARRTLNHEPSVESHNEKDADASNLIVNVSVEGVQPKEGKETDPGIQSYSNQNNVPKHSFMERNSTAHTYEWDDSIDGSPDGTSERMNRFNLPSPERKAGSPLKKYEIKKFAARRRTKRWSLEEEQALRDGVRELGVGNWKRILNSKRDIFAERTEVDLKDKWRNMTR